MQPYDYTIPRMQMPDLGQAFIRGIQIRDMLNAQNAQRRNEEVKSEFGKLLSQYGSAGEALKNLKSSKYAADLYEPLSNAYQMEAKQNQIPLDMETARLGVDRLKQSMQQSQVEQRKSDLQNLYFQAALEKDPMKRQQIISMAKGQQPFNQLEAMAPGPQATEEQLLGFAMGPEKYLSMATKGTVQEAKPFFRDVEGEEPVLINPDGTVTKLGLKPRPVKQEKEPAVKIQTVGGVPHIVLSDGSLVPATGPGGKPVDTGKTEFDKLPKENQIQITELSKKIPAKLSISNQIGGYLKEFKDNMALYEETGDKNYKDNAIRIGNQSVKALNSPEGADAVGAEEVKRLGSALEFQLGNLLGPGKFIGRDLEGFEKQMKMTIDAINTGISANNKQIDSLYGKKSNTKPTSKVVKWGKDKNDNPIRLEQ